MQAIRIVGSNKLGKYLGYVKSQSGKTPTQLGKTPKKQKIQQIEKQKVIVL